METLNMPVLLSGKNSCREALYEDSLWKNHIRSCKSFGGSVKRGFSMWLPVLRSGKGPKVFPMSVAYAQRLPILVAKILATKFGFVPDCLSLFVPSFRFF